MLLAARCSVSQQRASGSTARHCYRYRTINQSSVCTALLRSASAVAIAVPKMLVVDNRPFLRSDGGREPDLLRQEACPSSKATMSIEDEWAEQSASATFIEARAETLAEALAEALWQPTVAGHQPSSSCAPSLHPAVCQRAVMSFAGLRLAFPEA